MLSGTSPIVFVDELHRRWQVRKAEQAAEQTPVPEQGILPGATIKKGAVFLSYVREDKATVQAIKAQLEAANIDVWMDESGLEPGVDYQQVIQDNIKESSFFVAVISRAINPETWGGRFGRFVLKEWFWAVEESRERLSSDRFLQPIVIDDTPPGSEYVERPFRDLQWTALKDGKVPEDFIQILSQGIRRYRRSK